MRGADPGGAIVTMCDFKFEAAELVDLFDAVGRRDAATYALAADFEAALKVYLNATLRGAASSPGETLKRADWAARLSDELGAVLHAIGADVARMQAAQSVPTVLERRIGRDVEQAVTALGDLRLALGDLAQHVMRGRGSTDPEDALLEGCAKAYRNRLNRRPVAEVDGDFRRVLESALRRAAGRVPALNRVLAMLTQPRLAAVIERISPLRPSAPALELKLAVAES